MLGIDKTTISRFENAPDALVQKILHPLEIKELAAVANKAYFLAGRWAIKEALYKADAMIGNFNAIRIVKANEGERYEYPGYVISTTSEKDEYIAIVMKRGRT